MANKNYENAPLLGALDKNCRDKNPLDIDHRSKKFF